MDQTRSGRDEIYGPFLVHERLGTGGMAEVHRATRVFADGSRIEVGLKRLHPHLVDNPLVVKEFVEEARIASLMHHENICRFYEAGRFDHSYFIAMEYIEGQDLASLLKEWRSHRRSTPLGVVLSLLCQLCDALEYAHGRADEDTGAPLGFVHRDVSPSNILVSADGRVKVIDLGIAIARTREVRTGRGVIKGKFGYIAPEMLAGARADHRADIFAVGVVAWELLTAQRLFAGASDLETLEKIRRGPIAPPSSRRTDCPPRLDAIVMRALARRPHNRWPSASALRTALRALAATMHLPLSPDVVHDWMERARDASIPIPIPGEKSDAITQVRHRTPRTLPRPPARFPTGTSHLPSLASARARVTSAIRIERSAARPVATASDRKLSRPRVGVATRGSGSVARVAARGSGSVARVAGKTSKPIAAVAHEGTGPTARLTPTRNPRPIAREHKSRALAMLCGGLLTTAVIIGLLAARAWSRDHGVALGSPAPAVAEPDAGAPTAAPSRLHPAPDTDTDAAVVAHRPVAAAQARLLDPPRPEPDLVAASDMKRLSGSLPRSRASRARYRARLCVDEHGRVTSVEVTSGPERLYRRIARHLRRWRYRPYRRDGAAVPVCFEVEQALLPWR